MTQSKLFYFSRKTERIHNAILKHIAAAPYNMTIHLRRADFDLLRDSAIAPYMRTKEALDYVDGYQVKPEHL